MANAKDVLITITNILFNMDPYSTGCSENAIYDEYIEEATLITAHLLVKTNILTPGEIARQVMLDSFGFLPQDFEQFEVLLNTELEMF